MKTTAIIGLCVVISMLGYASSQRKLTLKYKKRSYSFKSSAKLNDLESQTPDMKKAIRLFEIETRRLKKRMESLNHSIKNHSVNSQSNIEINKDF